MNTYTIWIDLGDGPEFQEVEADSLADAEFMCEGWVLDEVANRFDCDWGVEDE